MQKRLREARDNRDAGFTLIELLIVIVVLGILATIVVFGVATFRGDAEAAACKSDLKTVQVATDAYVASGNPFPTGNLAIQTLVDAKYLKSYPKDTSPGDSTPYTFTVAAVSPNPANFVSRPCP
jgi:prepilin-type N-terminal cleavage/methylation domain-containing protein